MRRAIRRCVRNWPGGVDLAYESYFGAGGIFSLSGYGRRIRDVTTQQLFQQGSAWISRPVNDGNASAHGLKFDTRLPLRQWLADAPALELRLNGARNWSRLERVPGPGNRLDQQLPRSVNLGIDYRPSARATLGASLSVQTGGVTRISEQLSSYAGVVRTLDGYGLWQWDPHSRLRLSLSNLLHQSRWQGRAYADPREGASTRLSGTPSTAGVRLQFEHTL